MAPRWNLTKSRSVASYMSSSCKVCGRSGKLEVGCHEALGQGYTVRTSFWPGAIRQLDSNPNDAPARHRSRAGWRFCPRHRPHRSPQGSRRRRHPHSYGCGHQRGRADWRRVLQRTYDQGTGRTRPQSSFHYLRALDAIAPRLCLQRPHDSFPGAYLHIPLGVTATDFNTGEGVVFSSGSIIDPVRASCAYPGMFLPVETGGRWLVDGMLSHPVPTHPLRKMGAERVLAVHLKGQWSKAGAPRHLFDVIGQSFAIAQDMMGPVWRSAADCVIEPDVAGFDYDDFRRADELIHVGEQATRKALPQVREWFRVPGKAASPAAAPTLVASPVTMTAD